ncbi:zinc metalloprotease [Cohnella cholangitidis]|uniref:Uncharacterized protein n=1 Tax=Cohnella cholangitidis TaxID=2598458 RepID=A0A7G5BTF2_9BACL|nr:hypothetical protein [Cohnella cholangitidis]QMV40236.1 hypothetical protein FPL14_02740 [Cohnella cholangitidis]
MKIKAEPLNRCALVTIYGTSSYARRSLILPLQKTINEKVSPYFKKCGINLYSVDYANVTCPFPNSPPGEVRAGCLSGISCPPTSLMNEQMMDAFSGANIKIGDRTFPQIILVVSGFNFPGVILACTVARTKNGIKRPFIWLSQAANDDPIVIAHEIGHALMVQRNSARCRSDPDPYSKTDLCHNKNKRNIMYPNRTELILPVSFTKAQCDLMKKSYLIRPNCPDSQILRRKLSRRQPS